MTTATDETVAALQAQLARLQAQYGLPGESPRSREDLFRDIAEGLLLPDTAVQAIVKYGHEDSTVRITLKIDGGTRHMDCPVRKLPQLSYARGLVADVCDRVLNYEQAKWTKIANTILSAAEKVPGYERDRETIEWLSEFIQRACLVCSPTHRRRPADTYDLLMATRGRQTGALEASHRGEVFLILRDDGGIDFSQADFIAFVWTQATFRLGRGDVDQRLAAIGFYKAPVFARKGSQVAKLKSVWHSPAGWLKQHDVELPARPESKRGESDGE